MMIMSKQAIPMDIEEYNSVYQRYWDEIQWKLVHHMDGIAATRQAIHNREISNIKRLNPAAVIS